MEKPKERITENGIDYILIGYYYIPDLKLPEESRSIGRYGRLQSGKFNLMKIPRNCPRQCLRRSDVLWHSATEIRRTHSNSVTNQERTVPNITAYTPKN